jgi:hypothetical protein
MGMVRLHSGDKVVNLLMIDNSSSFFRHGLLLKFSVCFFTETFYCMHYTMKKKDIIEKLVMKRVKRS